MLDLTTHTYAVLRVPALDIVFIGTMSKTGYLTGYCWCKDKARFFEGGTFMSWNPTEF